MSHLHLVAMATEEEKERRRERTNRAWMERGRDEVASQHQRIHQELTRWGAWVRERYQQGVCSSIEHRFDNDGGRHTKEPVVNLPPDPMLARLENAILRIQKPHRFSLEEYYCKRNAPWVICWNNDIRYEDFSGWMFDCRQGVLNIMEANNMKPGTKALLIAWAICTLPIVAAVVATVSENGWPF